MSYPERGSYFEFFTPIGSGTLDSHDLSDVAAINGGAICHRRCRVTAILFLVTTQVAANTTAPTVTFRKRPTPGSSSGQSTVGVLTFPDGTAAGKIVRKAVSPVEFKAGDELTFDHTVAAADSGTAAGEGYYQVEAQAVSEVPGNEGDYVTST